MLVPNRNNGDKIGKYSFYEAFNQIINVFLFHPEFALTATHINYPGFNRKRRSPQYDNGPGGSNSYPGGSQGNNNYPGGPGGSDNYPGGNQGNNNYPGGPGGSDNYPGGNQGNNNYPGGPGGSDNYPGGNNNYPGGNQGNNHPGGSDNYPGGNQGNNNYPGGNPDWINNDSNYNDPTHKREVTITVEFTVTTESWQDTDKPTTYVEYAAGDSDEICQYSPGKTYRDIQYNRSLVMEKFETESKINYSIIG